MIKVSVMYPNQPGARFDHDYYRATHMPLVKERMGDKCRFYTIDKGVLAALSDAAVLELHRRGYLRLIDLMIASLGQLPVLTSRKNTTLLRGTETLAGVQPAGHA